MCCANVTAEVEHALAELLADMAAALCPENPRSVAIGPVDFGPPPAFIARGPEQ